MKISKIFLMALLSCGLIMTACNTSDSVSQSSKEEIVSSVPQSSQPTVSSSEVPSSESAVQSESSSNNQDPSSVSSSQPASSSSADTILDLAGKTFVGADLSEKDFIYYEAMKEVIESTTLVFGTDGTFNMTTTKRSSGSHVEEQVTLQRGTFQQTGNTYSITVTSMKFGNQDWMEMPVEYQTATNGSIEGNNILLETQNMDGQNQMVTLHMVLTLQA